MKIANRPGSAEKRNHPRIPLAKHIFFSTTERLFEGKIKDISRYGMCIEIADHLDDGEIITIALPFSDARPKKCKGQIVWIDKGRFGVELFKKRRPPELRIIRSLI